MAQYRKITGRQRNNRIDNAIPRLLSSSPRVHNKAQATAVAIRLESLGRLRSTGSTIKSAKKGGLVGAAGIASRALKRTGIPTRTITRSNSGSVFASAGAAAFALNSPKSTPESRRTARLYRDDS